MPPRAKEPGRTARLPTRFPSKKAALFRAGRDGFSMGGFAENKRKRGKKPGFFPRFLWVIR